MQFFRFICLFLTKDKEELFFAERIFFSTFAPDYL